MSNQLFHFCFSFTSLLLSKQVSLSLDQLAQFRVQLYKANQLVAQTRPFANDFNHSLQINIHEQSIRFTVNRLLVDRGPWVLKLIQSQPNEKQKLIGCYEFALSNYIKVYQQFNSNCSDLCVQIGHHIQIAYEVYVEKTQEALQRIISEHQAAKKMAQMDKLCSESTISFTDQTSQERMFGQSRQIKIDLNSPIFFQPKFWSPTRRRLSHKKDITRGVDCIEDRTLQQQVNNLNFLTFQKSSSNLSQMDHQKHQQVHQKHNIIKNSLIVRDIEDAHKNQEIHHQKRFAQLFEVISSQSKILLPKQIQSKQRPSTDRPKTSPKDSISVSGNAVRSRQQKNTKGHLKHYFMAFFLIVACCLAISFLFLPQQSVLRARDAYNDPRQKSKRRRTDFV